MANLLRDIEISDPIGKEGNKYVVANKEFYMLLNTIRYYELNDILVSVKSNHIKLLLKVIR